MSDRIDWWFFHTSTDVLSAWGQLVGGVGTWVGSGATIATVVVMLRQRRRTRRPERPVRIKKSAPTHRGSSVLVSSKGSPVGFDLVIENISHFPVHDVVVMLNVDEFAVVRYRDAFGRAWTFLQRAVRFG